MYTAHIPYVLLTGLVIYYTVKYTWSFSTARPAFAYTRTVFLVSVVVLYVLYLCNSVFLSIGIETISAHLLIIAVGIGLDLSTHTIPGKGYTAIIVSSHFFVSDPSQSLDQSMYYANLSLSVILTLVYCIVVWLQSRQHFSTSITIAPARTTFTSTENLLFAPDEIQKFL